MTMGMKHTTTAAAPGTEQRAEAWWPGGIEVCGGA